jgi:hypothetical protein
MNAKMQVRTVIWCCYSSAVAVLAVAVRIAGV